jgi:hypothetical protein
LPCASSGFLEHQGRYGGEGFKLNGKVLAGLPVFFLV